MEKIWYWPLQASPHDMTKMIQTFHQISGQLGTKTKSVNQVVFQAKQIKSFQATSGRRRQRRLERSKDTSLVTIRMVTIGNDYVSVGLFHRWTEDESQLDDVDKFLAEMLDDFVTQGHLQELIGLRDQLSDIAAEKLNLAVDRDDILNTFKPFEPVVEALRAKYALAEIVNDM
jgi:hypothetical protein